MVVVIASAGVTASLAATHTQTLRTHTEGNNYAHMITPAPVLFDIKNIARDVNYTQNWSPTFSQSAWVCGSYAHNSGKHLVTVAMFETEPSSSGPVGCDTTASCVLVQSQPSTNKPVPYCCNVEDVPVDGSAPFLDLEYCEALFPFISTYTGCVDYPTTITDYAEPTLVW